MDWYLNILTRQLVRSILVISRDIFFFAPIMGVEGKCISVKLHTIHLPKGTDCTFSQDVSLFAPFHGSKRNASLRKWLLTRLTPYDLSLFYFSHAMARGDEHSRDDGKLEWQWWWWWWCRPNGRTMRARRARSRQRPQVNGSRVRIMRMRSITIVLPSC